MSALRSTLAVAATIGVIAMAAAPVLAQETTDRGQKLLSVDWANGEVAAAAQRSQLESVRTRSVGPTAGLDPVKLGKLEIPVLAFAETPQLVRNILGNDAKPIKPRSLVMDPDQPYWYQIEDTYEGITISVAADRRINLEATRNFQITARRAGAEGQLGTQAAPRISITDGETEEGMEGVILNYRLRRFPDIPYTIKIVCSGEKMQRCKDLATIAKDQSLLRVLAARPK